MDLKWLEEGDLLVVKLSGNLDGGSAPAVTETIEQKLSAGPRDLVIEFSGVDYISSAGLRVVIKANQTVRSAGKNLILCGMKDFVREVFNLAGLSKILDIRQELADAI